MRRYLPTKTGDIAYLAPERVLVLSHRILDEVEHALHLGVTTWRDSGFPGVLKQAQDALAEFRAARAACPQVQPPGLNAVTNQALEAPQTPSGR